MLSYLCILAFLCCFSVQIISTESGQIGTNDGPDVAQRIWRTVFNHAQTNPDNVRTRRESVVSTDEEVSGVDHSELNESTNKKEEGDLEKQAEEYAKQLYELRRKYPKLNFDSPKQIVSVYSEENKSNNNSNEILESRVYLQPKIDHHRQKNGTKNCQNDASDIIIEQRLKVIRPIKDEINSSNNFRRYLTDENTSPRSTPLPYESVPISSSVISPIFSVKPVTQGDTAKTSSITVDPLTEFRSGEINSEESTEDDPPNSTQYSAVEDKTTNSENNESAKITLRPTESVSEERSVPQENTASNPENFTDEASVTTSPDAMETFTSSQPNACDNNDKKRKYKLSKADWDFLAHNFESIKSIITSRNSNSVCGLDKDCQKDNADILFKRTEEMNRAVIVSQPSLSESLGIPTTPPDILQNNVPQATTNSITYPHNSVNIDVIPTRSLTDTFTTEEPQDSRTSVPIIFHSFKNVANRKKYPHDDSQEMENFRRSLDSEPTDSPILTKNPVRTKPSSRGNVTQDSQVNDIPVYPLYKQDGDRYSILSEKEYNTLFNDGVKFSIYKFSNGNYVKIPSFIQSPFYKLVSGHYIKVPSNEYENVINKNIQYPLYKLVEGKYLTVPEYEALEGVHNFFQDKTTEMYTTGGFDVKNDDLVQSTNGDLEKHFNESILKGNPSKLYKLEGNQYTEIPRRDFKSIIRGTSKYPLYKWSSEETYQKVPDNQVLNEIQNIVMANRRSYQQDPVSKNSNNTFYKLVDDRYVEVPETEDLNIPLYKLVAGQFIRVPKKKTSKQPSHELDTSSSVEVPEDKNSNILKSESLHKKTRNRYKQFPDASIRKGHWNQPLYRLVKSQYVAVPEEQPKYRTKDTLTKWMVEQSFVKPDDDLNTLTKYEIRDDAFIPTPENGVITYPPLYKQDGDNLYSEIPETEFDSIVRGNINYPLFVLSRGKYMPVQLVPNDHSTWYKFQFMTKRRTGQVPKSIAEGKEHQVLIRRFLNTSTDKSSSGYSNGEKQLKFAISQSQFKDLLVTQPQLEQQLNHLPDRLYFTPDYIIPGISAPYSSFKDEKAYLDFLRQQNKKYNFEILFPGLANYLFVKYRVQPKQISSPIPAELNDKMYTILVFLKKIMESSRAKTPGVTTNKASFSNGRRSFVPSSIHYDDTDELPINGDEIYEIRGYKPETTEVKTSRSSLDSLSNRNPRTISKFTLVYPSVDGNGFEEQAFKKRMQELIRKYPHLQQLLDSLPDFSNFKLEQFIPGINKPYSSFKSTEEYAGFLYQKNDQYEFEFVLPGLTDILIAEYQNRPSDNGFPIPESLLHDIYEALMYLRGVKNELVDQNQKFQSSSNRFSYSVADEALNCDEMSDSWKTQVENLVARLPHLKEQLISLDDSQFTLEKIIPGIDRPYATFKDADEYQQFLQHKNNQYEFKLFLPTLPKILLKDYLANPTQTYFHVSDFLKGIVFDRFSFFKNYLKLCIKPETRFLDDLPNGGSRRTTVTEVHPLDDYDNEVFKRNMLDLIPKLPHLQQLLNSLPDFSHFQLKQFIPGIDRPYSSFQNVQEYNEFLRKKNDQSKFELLFPRLTGILVSLYKKDPSKTLFDLPKRLVYQIHKILLYLKNLQAEFINGPPTTKNELTKPANGPRRSEYSQTHNGRFNNKIYLHHVI